jgi:hypothetical protein
MKLIINFLGGLQQFFNLLLLSQLRRLSCLFGDFLAFGGKIMKLLKYRD